jgi:nifR3 family TIM-barrel protein
LNQPLRIGPLTLASRLVLAPMSQLGHQVLRGVIDDFGGCGLLFSEMCSACRVPHENTKISPFFCRRESEKARLVVQLVGSDGAQMALAARRIEAEGLAGVDINCGCAAGAICRRGAGAALLTEPAKAAAIVAAVVRAVDLPVFVKFRTGWQDDAETAVALARRFEDAGAKALTFHPRVAPDRRCRPARWEYIAAVKAAVNIPVFGNGDVFCAADCLKMLQMTGCDGVALGRLAVARPWIFATWTGRYQPLTAVFRQTATAMAQGLARCFDPPTALRRFNRFALYFAPNFGFGHSLLKQIQGVKHIDAVGPVLDRFFDANPPMVDRPTLNLFG